MLIIAFITGATLGALVMAICAMSGRSNEIEFEDIRRRTRMYPEPSIHDHNAPWNMDEWEELDDEGNVIESGWQCNCFSCDRNRRKSCPE